MYNNTIPNISNLAMFDGELRQIPNDIIDEKIWCLWRLEEKQGRKTKVPYQINGTHASTAKPDTWTDFDSCHKKLGRSIYNGIGLMFHKSMGRVFIDLDHHLIDGKPDEVAEEFLQAFPDTYIETSQSGTGLHLFVKGSIPNAVKNSKKGVEMYDTGRYCACTFNTWHDCSELQQNDEELERLFNKYNLQKKVLPKRNPQYWVSRSVSMDDEEIIHRAAMHDHVFADLYRGDWQAYCGSHSEADFRLCLKLAYWTERDPAQIERIFNTSGLVRDKWFDRGETYRRPTIEKACATCNRTYSEWQTIKEEMFRDFYTKSFGEG